MIDKYDIYQKAMRLRKNFGLDADSPVDIFTLAKSIENLTLVLYPLGENISGACYKDGNTSLLIVINSQLSLGRQHFSLAHEMYHAYFDAVQNQTVCPLNFNSRSENERKADIFASFFLMPDTAIETAIEKIIKNKTITKECVIRLEQYFNVSHMAMLIRLKEKGLITEEELSDFQTEVKKTANRIGVDTSLYEPSPEKDRVRTFGYYIAKAGELLEEGVISNGKYEELLLDAFREDMVFESEMDDYGSI